MRGMWQDWVLVCVQLVAVGSLLLMTRDVERPSQRHCALSVGMSATCALTWLTLGLWLSATVQVVYAVLWVVVNASRPTPVVDQKEEEFVNE